MWVPFLRPFPGNEAHKLFLGGQNGVFWVGAKKFMLKKFMCFFGPLDLEGLTPKFSTGHPGQKLLLLG